MTELVIILGVLLFLTLWIAGHNIYRWRTDVLTGRYFLDADQEPAVTEERTDGVGEAAAEERRKTRAFLMGWDSDQAVPEPRCPIDAGSIDPGDSGADSVTAVPTQTVAPTK